MTRALLEAVADAPPPHRPMVRCANCGVVVPQDEHGACSHCGSENVTTPGAKAVRELLRNVQGWRALEACWRH